MSTLVQVLVVIPIVLFFSTLDAKQARFYTQTFRTITQQYIKLGQDARRNALLTDESIAPSSAPNKLRSVEKEFDKMIESSLK